MSTAAVLHFSGESVDSGCVANTPYRVGQLKHPAQLS